MTTPAHPARTSEPALAARTGRSLDADPGQPVWLRTVVGWHVAFWGVLAASAVLALSVDLHAWERATYLGLLAVLGLAYAFLGQPAATSRDPGRAHAYRLVLVVVTGCIAAFFPETMLLLYMAYPQVWFLSSRNREGVFFSVLLTAAVAIGIFAHGGWSLAALADVAPWMVVSLSVSVVLGLWIAKVIDQSEDRAQLIHALQSTRDELAAAHHATGVVAERERMAREIHDTLAQGFTSIVMLAETAGVQLARDRADLAADQLALIERTARDNLAEARALVAAFSPVALHDGTLPDAVRRLAGRFTAETGVVVDVRCEPDDEAVAGLHAGQQVVLLRAAQEALTNIRKHAAASRASIEISARAEQPASIEVRDDGAGFEPDAAPSTGFGLAGMRGRVEDIGGVVQVTSQPGSGTQVRVLLPAAPEPATP